MKTFKQKVSGLFRKKSPSGFWRYASNDLANPSYKQAKNVVCETCVYKLDRKKIELWPIKKERGRQCNFCFAKCDLW